MTESDGNVLLRNLLVVAHSHFTRQIKVIQTPKSLFAFLLSLTGHLQTQTPSSHCPHTVLGNARTVLRKAL